jgi:CRP-like cAMP-binding protein
MWFPESCVISLVVPMSTGYRITAGIIGREGAVGASVEKSSSAMVASLVVQITGTALLLPAATFRRLLSDGHGLQLLLRRHTDALHGQVMQLAACNALHSAEVRLARFLLSVADRIGPDAPLRFTQEDLAEMLGVQRSMVNARAALLQRMGLITYRRGTMVIQERTGLETVACECYNVIRKYDERLLGVRY